MKNHVHSILWLSVFIFGGLEMKSVCVRHCSTFVRGEAWSVNVLLIHLAVILCNQSSLMAVVLFTTYSALMLSVVQTYRKLWFFNVSFNPQPLIRIHLNFSHSHKKKPTTQPRTLCTFCKRTHKLSHCIQNHDRYRIINIHTVCA